MSDTSDQFPELPQDNHGAIIAALIQQFAELEKRQDAIAARMEWLQIQQQQVQARDTPTPPQYFAGRWRVRDLRPSP